MTPSEFFNLPIIGKATTPPIASFSAEEYDVIKIIDLGPEAGKSFVTNKWFQESSRVPLVVVEQLGATYRPLKGRR